MKNKSIKQVTGTAVPVQGNDIDTDRIIPARHLRSITFEGLGQYAFEDDRKQADGKHPFDEPQYSDASILLVNRNFGSGSSREHAPQALMRWGINAIIGESFGEIFFGNSTTIGIPCLTVKEQEAQFLQESIRSDSSQSINIDLDKQLINLGLHTIEFQLIESVRQSFLSGEWDSLGQLLEASQDTQKVYEGLPYIAGFTHLFKEHSTD
tara:strand:+ start:198 stop:824 length:627 start_codon:yes stop_codon:yes gene_type:complete